MQDHSFSEPFSHIRSGGCVHPYVQGFATELVADGYTMLSARDHLRAATHFGRWMDLRGITVDGFTEEVLIKFARHKCKCPGAGRHHFRPSQRAVARVRRFIDYLRDQAIVPRAVAAEGPAVAAILVEFSTFAKNHRGLTAGTIRGYENMIARMLPALGDDPGSYDAALVRRVLLDEVRPHSLAYAKHFASALRVFLRFLSAMERCKPHLEHAVPTIAEWKFSALPRYLDASDIERVVNSCDLDRPHGVRDRAVLLLLARLALRAGDIVTMRLGDLDWDAGTVRVRGKGRREVRLPLPQEVGEAVAEYLVQVRPRADTNQVFLCANAPIRPFAGSSTVSCIVRAALVRSGIGKSPSKGAHLLRHSAATAMLRSGASLDAIAAVLRHESLNTTAYYAKVDLALLDQLTQQWPEGTPC